MAKVVGWFPSLTGLKNGAGTQIDPATEGTLQSLLGKMPASIDADGGFKVHLMNIAGVTISGTASTDVTDRSGRLLGHVTVDSLPSVTGTVSVSNMIPAVETGLSKTADVQAVRDRLPSALNTDGGLLVHVVNQTGVSATVDVTDRVGRILGHIVVDNFPITQAISGTVGVSNMIPAVETGLAKDATFAKDADGGIKTHVQNFPSTYAATQSGVWSAGRTWTLSSASDSVSVSNFPATQPISAASLPLPSGAATESTLLAVKSLLPTALNGDGGLLVHVVNQTTGSTDVTDRSGRLLGHVTVDNSTLSVTQSGTWTTSRSWTLASGTDSVTIVPSGTQTVAGSVSVSNFPGTYDTSDRAGRLLGVVYGSLAQIQQTATNFNLKTELFTGATVYDARQIRALTSSDVVSAAQSGTWTTGRTWSLSSGTDTVAIGGSVAVTGPITDTQIRASPLPVLASTQTTISPSGTVAANPGPGNSFNGTLGVSAQYVGPWEDVSSYSSVTIIVAAVQNSATNGAKIQWSNDASTVLRTISQTVTGYPLAAAVGGVFSFGTEAQYFRINYTQGTTSGQVVAQTIYRSTPIMAPELPLGSTITDLNLASIVRSVQAGKQPSGAYSSQRYSGVSVGNTTNTLLAAKGSAGDMFTGVWEDLVGYTGLTILLQASVNSDTNGITIQYSDDGVTVRRSVSYSYTTAPTGRVIIVPMTGRYVRVLYQNGTSAQTGSWALQTIYSVSSTELTRVQFSDNVFTDQLTVLTKSEIVGKDSNAVYQNISASTSGNFNINVNEITAPIPVKALTSHQSAQWTVGATAVQIVNPALTGRKSVVLKSLAGTNQTIYIGNSNTVSSINGFPLANGEIWQADVDSTVAIYAIATAAAQVIASSEVS